MEKRGADSSTGQDSSTLTTPKDKLNREMTDYEQLRDVSAAQDPLAWWGQHEADLPILAQFAQHYKCIPASSCASERVFSIPGNVCSPRHSRLSAEHLDILVFLAKNLNKTKSLSQTQ